MHIIIETERLILREFTSADASILYMLNSDPEVTKYTGDPMHNETEASDVLEKIILPQYVLYNHGRWAVHLKGDMEFIGWCGLKAVPERKEIDLGYRFIREAWGKGFATESAYASLKYGFEKLLIPRIIGRAVPENLASIHVLEKCGMKFFRHEFVDRHPAKTYEALNPLF